jgi:hypothetical protein
MEHEITLSGEGVTVSLFLRAEGSGNSAFFFGVAEIAAPPFSGSVRLWYSTANLVAFRDALREMQRALNGRLEFCSDDGELFIVIELTRGRARITGKAVAFQVGEVSVSFDFASDQSYLGTSLQQVAAALRTGVMS